MPTRRHVVVVATESRFGTARIPVVLHNAGARVTILGDSRAAVCWSRFVDKIIPCDVSEAGISNALRATLASYEGRRPWVILSDERAVRAASACRDEPWMQGVFPVDPRGPMADAILRKTSFMQLAGTAGLPVPLNRVCHTLAEARAAAMSLRFPLFVKRDIDCAGAGVAQVHRPEEIAGAFAKFGRYGPVLVQETVRGTVAKINILYAHGKPMCWSYAYALRSWPGKFGPSCVRQYFCDPQIDDMVERLGSLTGFHGLCGFDAIRDSQTGQFFIIEFNGRLTPHYHLATHVGVDYSTAMASFLNGEFVQQRPRIIGETAPLIYVFPQDVRRCISEHDLRGALKWLPGLTTKDIPWNDANLILQFLLTLVQRAIEHLRQKLTRRKSCDGKKTTHITAPVAPMSKFRSLPQRASSAA